MHIKHEFKVYVQIHEITDNTMQEQMVGAIALRPTGNEQGSNYFLSLTTGRQLDRLQATELPMPQNIIDHVHFLTKTTPLDYNPTTATATLFVTPWNLTTNPPKYLGLI